MKPLIRECSSALLARKKAFVDTALDLFLTRGFSETSVNEVVRRAGGSLATLYRLFPSKDALFEAIISEHLLELFEPLKTISEYTDLGDALLAVGRNYVEVTSSPRALAIFRVLVKESPRCPQLREIFLAQGFSKLKECFKSFLEQACSRGQLDIPDVERAASHFFGLLRAPWHLPSVCGEELDLGPKALDDIVESAVTVFMRGYAPAKRGAS